VGGVDIGECSECGHKVCSHVMAQIRDIKIRLNRAIDFVEPYIYCPCCESEKECSPDCTLSSDLPEQYECMAEARRAMWGGSGIFDNKEPNK